MNYLITGASGFLGQALTSFLLEKGHNIFGIDLSKTNSMNTLPSEYQIIVDINDTDTLSEKISDLNLDGVFHLAAQASVFQSWERPLKTYNINILGTASLIEALNTKSKKPKLLFSSSAEVYGDINSLECTEDTMLNTSNPYGLSKQTAEIICRISYPNHVIARQFSIIGVGHSETYAIPGFCKQVANMKKGEIPPILKVGNIDVFRNFTSVKDILRAYLLLMEKDTIGNIYNIASNDTVTLKNILLLLKEISGIDFKIEVDPMRFRPVDSTMTSINFSKIEKLGWSPEEELKNTIKEVYESFL